MRRRFDGYMTLEASLLFPMVVCVIVLIISFSYYLYGRCIISQDAYILAFRASLESRQGTDAAGFVSGAASSVAGRKYFGSSFPGFETSTLGKEITVTGKAQANHAAMGRYFLKPREGWDYSARASAEIRSYSSHIRRIKRLSDLGSEILDLGE